MPPGVTDAFRDSHEHIHWWVRRLLDGPFRAGTSPFQHYPSVERYVLDLLSRGEDDEHLGTARFWPAALLRSAPPTCSDDLPGRLVRLVWDEHGDELHGVHAALSRSPQRLIMGPWVHGAGEENYAGEVEFDVEAAQDSWDDMRLRWFDRWLKGLDSGVDSEPPVKLFLMGGGDDDGRMTTGDRLLRGGSTWRTAQDWPLPETEPTPYWSARRWRSSPRLGPTRQPGRPPATASIHGIRFRRPAGISRLADPPDAAGWVRSTQPSGPARLAG